VGKIYKVAMALIAIIPFSTIDVACGAPFLIRKRSDSPYQST